MTDSRTPPRSRPSYFGRLWRMFLPAAIGLMIIAVVTGVGDSGAQPAWTFGAGALLGLIGVTSLVVHLLALGREEARRIERRLEDRIEGGKRR